VQRGGLPKGFLALAAATLLGIAGVASGASQATSPKHTNSTLALAASSDLGSALPPPLAVSSGKTFYVSTTGSDSAAGSLSAPWKTIGRALTAVNPGDTIFVRAGTYSPSLLATRSGTATGTITLAGYPGEQPVITGRLRISADYMRINGFVFDGSAVRDVSVWLNGNHLELSGNAIRNGYMTGVYAGNGGTGGKVTDVRILSNTIQNNGTHTSADHGVYCGDCFNSVIADNLITGNKAAGVQLYPNANGTIVASNTIARNGKYGIILGSDSGTTSSNNLIVGNVIANNAENGIRTYWGAATGSGNVARNDLAFGNPQGNFANSGQGISYSANLQSDPRFLSSTDFRLASGSPAQDVADAAYAPVLDLDGSARVGAADLGAFETH
jgi:parallel beta-helix repeat protein